MRPRSNLRAAGGNLENVPPMWEPDRTLGGVSGVNSAEADVEREAFGALYSASYARLVGVVGAVAQDRHLAEEAVQDAFVRLLGQWSKVCRYDNPEAFVRKTAFGFVSNRRRKIRNSLSAALRHGPAADAPAPSGDSVDLRRALATLPMTQRQVIVLQDLGLGVQDIARQLEIPVGTVKSRLSRARGTLAPLLREEADRHV